MRNAFEMKRIGIVLMSLVIAMFAGSAQISADGGETDAYAGGATDTYTQPSSQQVTVAWSGETDLAGESDVRARSGGIVEQTLALAVGETDAWAGDTVEVEFHAASHQDSLVWSGETDLAGESDVRAGSGGIIEQTLALAVGETDAWAGGAVEADFRAASHQDSVVWSGKTDLAGEAIDESGIKGGGALVALSVDTATAERIVMYIDGMGETDAFANDVSQVSLNVITVDIESINVGEMIHHEFAEVAAGATDQAAGIMTVSVDICDSHGVNEPMLA